MSGAAVPPPWHPFAAAAARGSIGGRAPRDGALRVHFMSIWGRLFIATTRGSRTCTDAALVSPTEPEVTWHNGTKRGTMRVADQRRGMQRGAAGFAGSVEVYGHTGCDRAPLQVRWRLSAAGGRRCRKG